MAFEKGNKHGKGRPNGAFNNTTSNTREKMTFLLGLVLEKIQEKIDKMENRELIEAANLLAKHTVPIPKEENNESTEQVIVITGNLLK